MRQSIRAEVKAGAENIAVVCGAWHAPALAEPRPGGARPAHAARPARRSRWRRPGCRGPTACWRATAATAPASTRRPGTTSCSTRPTQPGRALAGARRAAAARARASTPPRRRSSTPTRLAGALAGIRDRPLAGLDELLDATRAVLCHGSDVPLELVRAELVVGNRLGEVPPETPMVPLQQDVARLQRRLRLKPEATVEGAHARPAPPERPRAQPAPAPAEPARGPVGHAGARRAARAARSRRRSGSSGSRRSRST